MGQGEKEKSVPRPRALRVHVVFGEMQRVQGRCGRVWEMRWEPCEDSEQRRVMT